MTPADASLRLVSLLWQASWQGALFAVAVGLLCLAFRVPAPYRAALWFVAGLKFLGGFLYLLFNGRGVPVPILFPAKLLPVPPASVVSENPFVVYAPWVAATWLAGWLFCILTVVLRARATYRTLSRSRPYSDPATGGTLATLSRRLGVAPGQTPPVYVAPDETGGPQVTLAGNRGVLVLPETLLPPAPTALSETDLRFVLAHELAHIRRGDLWAGLILAAMHTLFFFHPCAAWVKREWEAAREEACDLLALSVCADSGDRDTTARYGALLLRLGSGGGGANSPASARITASPFSALRRRLTHLTRYQAERRGRFSPVLLLIGLPMLAVSLPPFEARWIPPSPPVIPRGTALLRAARPAVAPVASATKTRPVQRFAPATAAPVPPRRVVGHPRRVVGHPAATAAAAEPTMSSNPVSQPQPAPRRPFITRSAVSVAAEPRQPVLSDPPTVAGTTPVALETPVSVFQLTPAVPEIVAGSFDSSTPSTAETAASAATTALSGTPTASRVAETAVAARVSGNLPDTKTASPPNPAPSAAENTRSVSPPRPAPSPTPPPVEDYPRGTDGPLPPRG